VLPVPIVDLGLQPVPLIEQFPVARPQIPEQFGEALPEGRGIDSRAGCGLVCDEVMQWVRDLQASDLDEVHACGPSDWGGPGSGSHEVLALTCRVPPVLSR